MCLIHQINEIIERQKYAFHDIVSLNDANNVTDMRKLITRHPLYHDFGESDENRSIYRFLIYNDDGQVQFSYKFNGAAHYLRTTYIDDVWMIYWWCFLMHFPTFINCRVRIWMRIRGLDMISEFIMLLFDGPSRYKGFKVICPWGNYLSFICALGYRFWRF